MEFQIRVFPTDPDNDVFSETAFDEMVGKVITNTNFGDATVIDTELSLDRKSALITLEVEYNEKISFMMENS